MFDRRKYVCVVDDPQHPELNGKCFPVTGESDQGYSLEYGEVTFTVKKEFCKETNEKGS